MKIIAVYDAYNLWIKSIREACDKRSDWTMVELDIGSGIPQGAYVFIRPTMEEKQLAKEKEWIEPFFSRPDLKFITDRLQVMFYEDKCAQAREWSYFLPPTWVITSKEAALSFLDVNTDWPLVSKAAVGASSTFVSILGKEEAKAQVIQAFGDGIPLQHGNWDRQKGYVLFQKFIPANEFTWRANVIGREVAVFKRFNYPDKPVAQTGNTKPVSEIDPMVDRIIRAAKHVAKDIETKWVALDILHDHNEDQLYLLETSLGWPWPGVGEGAKFFPSERPWSEMFELMFDEMDKGVFD